MKLKPCPKCGSERVQYLQCTGAIKCKSCGYKMIGKTTESETVLYWNNTEHHIEKG